MSLKTSANWVYSSEIGAGVVVVIDADSDEMSSVELGSRLIAPVRASL